VPAGLTALDAVFTVRGSSLLLRPASWSPVWKRPLPLTRLLRARPGTLVERRPRSRPCLRAGGAWTGLREHAQWWFPMIIGTLAGSDSPRRSTTARCSDVHRDLEREGGERGDSPEAMQGAQQFMASTPALLLSNVSPLVFIPLIMMLLALLVWFAIGFILGRRSGIVSRSRSCAGRG